MKWVGSHWASTGICEGSGLPDPIERLRNGSWLEKTWQHATHVNPGRPKKGSSVRAAACTGHCIPEVKGLQDKKILGDFFSPRATNFKKNSWGLFFLSELFKNFYFSNATFLPFFSGGRGGLRDSILWERRRIPLTHVFFFPFSLQYKYLVNLKHILKKTETQTAYFLFFFSSCTGHQISLTW